MKKVALSWEWRAALVLLVPSVLFVSCFILFVLLFVVLPVASPAGEGTVHDGDPMGGYDSDSTARGIFLPPVGVLFAPRFVFPEYLLLCSYPVSLYISSSFVVCFFIFLKPFLVLLRVWRTGYVN